MKKIILGLTLVMIGLGSWYAFFRKIPAEYELKTERLTSGDITAVVTASGKLNAISVVEVGTQVSGTIKEIFVDYNSPVKAGQLIAQLDPTVLRSQLLESRANLELAKAGLVSAKASLTDSERKQKRSKELYGRNLIARSEWEAAETDLLLKKAQVQEAQARIAQARAAVVRAETNLEYTRITSPVDGVIVSRKVDVGQTVAASFQTPTLFSIARDLTRMQIDASIDEADIGRVAEGQEADFQVDAFPEELFKGKVVQVRIAPETTDNVVTYTVVIYVDNADMRLKPGMTANVSLKTDFRRGVLRIPAAALRFRPPQLLLEGAVSADTKDAGLRAGKVWLKTSEGKLRSALVETGISDGGWVEMISGDLKPDDELIVAAFIRNSQNRRPRSPF